MAQDLLTAEEIDERRVNPQILDVIVAVRQRVTGSEQP